LGRFRVADGRLPRPSATRAGVLFNDGEIAEAAWFTRAVRAALATVMEQRLASRLLLRDRISIAREIIESWRRSTSSCAEIDEMGDLLALAPFVRLGAGN